MDMDMDMNDHGESDSTNGDGEGVWSPDIEQCFREALLLFPPCGRRKHILQEEGGGKMYGRNELIARHIMMRTGKSRTRKQVSSHIQVLARRKAKAEAASNSSSGVSPAPSGIGGRPQSQPNEQLQVAVVAQGGQQQQLLQHQQPSHPYYDIWIDRAILTQKIRLVEFSAFIEYRNFQQTSGINSNNQQPSSVSSSALTGGSAATLAADQDLVSGSLQQQMQAYPVQTNQQQPQSQPLSSNHHLPAQFNQANTGHYLANNNGQLQHHQHQQQQQQSHLAIQNAHCMANVNGSHQQFQQQPQLSAGFTRHSYVKIDYRLSSSGRGSRQEVNQLEKIAISQIQDKFPEIGGSEGLFQRGPSDAFYLIKFWADLNNDYEYNIEDQNSYFGFSSHFETVDPYRDITCSTKACSYGCLVVEKVEKIYSAFNSLNGRYFYEISRSPMCEFMVQFIKKLRELPRASQMNSVLENFTVLQVITRESTPEILLCLAYVFEVASSAQNNGPRYHIYKLTRD